jgi:hypothetical protein
MAGRFGPAAADFGHACCLPGVTERRTLQSSASLQMCLPLCLPPN